MLDVPAVEEKLSAVLYPKMQSFGHVFYVWVHRACFERCPSAGEEPPDILPHPPAVPPLRPLEELRSDALSPDPSKRRGCTRDLGSHGNPAAVGLLIRLLEDSNVEVRRTAATALGRTWDEAAVEPLIAALRDPSPGVREEAATALGLIGDSRALLPLEARWDDREPSIARRAVTAVGNLLGEGSTASLLKAVRHPVEPIRLAAIEALSAREAPEARDALTSIVSDAEAPERCRAAAAKGLGLSRSREAIPSLIAALGTTFWQLRHDAAVALARCGAESARDELIELMMRDDELLVRGAAAGALCELEDPHLVEPFLKAFTTDSYEGVRNAAARFLSRCKDPRCIEPALLAIHHANSDVRYGAVDILKNFNEPRVVDALRAARKDLAESVRNIAGQALEELGQSAVAENSASTTTLRVFVEYSSTEKMEAPAFRCFGEIFLENDELRARVHIAAAAVSDASHLAHLTRAYFRDDDDIRASELIVLDLAEYESLTSADNASRERSALVDLMRALDSQARLVCWLTR